MGFYWCQTCGKLLDSSYKVPFCKEHEYLYSKMLSGERTFPKLSAEQDRRAAEIFRLLFPVVRNNGTWTMVHEKLFIELGEIDPFCQEIVRGAVNSQKAIDELNNWKKQRSE